MKVNNLSPRALLIEFPTRKELNLTCFRMSEFSEGPDELRKYYTPDIFIDLMSTKAGNLKYFSYWEGHNIPVKTLKEFQIVFAMDLSDREVKVLFSLSRVAQDGYVIFMQEGDEETLKHEKCHLFYHEHSEYKKQVDAITSELPPVVATLIKSGLYKQGYTDSVLQDEIQAYTTAYYEEEWDEMFPKVTKKEITPFVKRLNDVYLQFDK